MYFSRQLRPLLGKFRFFPDDFQHFFRIFCAAVKPVVPRFCLSRGRQCSAKCRHDLPARFAFWVFLFEKIDWIREGLK
jgi:hypothetical protein